MQADTTLTAEDQPREDHIALWKRGALVYGVVAALVCFIMRDAVMTIITTMQTSNTYGHIILIPLVLAWLVWNRWPELKQIRPAAMPWAAILMLGTGAIWLLGQVADVQLVQQLALIFSLQVLVLAVFGPAGLLALAFPTFFMIFLVPFGEEFVPQLQAITAHFIVWWLNFLDIPVYTDGIFLQTPSGDFEVAEACSGVRFMISTLALGFIFANLCFKSIFRRSLIVILALAVPIVANGFRAFGTVYLAYLTDNTVAVGVDHLIYGWIFFAFVTVVLILIGLTFSDRSVQEPPVDVAFVKRFEGGVESGGERRFFIAGGAVAGIAVLFSGLFLWVDGRRPDQLIAAYTPPQLAGGWTYESGQLNDQWVPNFEGADQSALQHYSKGEDIASLYRAGYDYQREGAELISYANKIFAPRDVWVRARGGGRKVVIGGRTLNVEYIQMRGPYGNLRDVWQVYWVNGKFTASPVRAKIEAVLAKLTGGSLHSAILAVSAPVMTDGGGEATLERFAEGLPDPLTLVKGPTD